MIWENWAPSACLLVDRCNCEQVTDHAVRQFYAAWSSLTILASGLCLFRQFAKKTHSPAEAALRPYLLSFASLVAIVGISSAFFHASISEMGSYFDFGSIYWIFTWIFLFTRKPTDRNRYPWLSMIAGSFLLILAYTLLTAKFPQGRFVWATLSGIPAFGGMWGLYRDPRFKGQLIFKQSLLIFAIGLAVFVLDQTRIWCDPLGWLHGHTLWHFAVARALWGLGQSMASLADEAAESRAIIK